MKSQYASTPTGDEMELNDLELRDVRIPSAQSRTLFNRQEKQRQMLREPLWKRALHSTATRNIGMGVLLVFLVGASIIGYIYHHAPSTDAKSTYARETENGEKAPKQLTSMQTDDADRDNNERLPQLRSFSRYEKPNTPENIGQMYVYFRKTMDDGGRRVFERLSFPVARYSRRRFPFIGPFISLMPSIPIFADRHNKQTIIYSKDSLYVLPSLINRFEQYYSISELTASGHASLYSSGVRPSGTINMVALFQPYPLVGSRIPRINPLTGGFMGGIESNYGSFSIPRYKRVMLDIDSLVQSEEEESESKEETDQYRSRPGNAGYGTKYPAKTKTMNREILTTPASAKPTPAIDNVAFFQASNLKNQLGGLAPKAVTYTGVDSLNLYTVFKNGTVSYRTAGIYFGIYAGQIGSPRGNGVGDIHIWSRRNNQDEANSNSIQTVERGGTSVLVFSTVFQTQAYRQSSVAFSATVPNPCTTLGLIATDFGYEPVVPSIISSEIQLSNLNTPVNYAGLTSSQTQLGSLTSQAVTLNVQGDIRGVGTTTTGADGYIEFTESKLYFAIACGQVGRALSSLAEGEVHLWWQLNQDSIPNSNTIQNTRGGSTAVLVSQGIVSVKANDKLKVMFSSTDSNLGLIASTPANEPAVPSLILVLFELDGQQKSLPYAQFSSLVSQPGCLTARAVQLGNDDGSRRITFNNDIIRFQESGIYFLMAAAQVGSFSAQSVGDVHLWMRLNQEDMANSNTIQTIVNQDTAVLVCQTVVVLKAGDQLQLMFSTDVTTGTLGLVATKPPNEPWVPSMIFSAFKSKF